MSDPADAPDYANTEAYPPPPAVDAGTSDAQRVLDAAADVDAGHHMQATHHLTDEAIARAGIRQPAFRPDVDDKGAHTGRFRAIDAPSPEAHG